jgi:hypothetical protein
MCRRTSLSTVRKHEKTDAGLSWACGIYEHHSLLSPCSAPPSRELGRWRSAQLQQTYMIANSRSDYISKPGLAVMISV